MPWRESAVMEERLRFVARRLAGEPMTALCRGFGISRKIGVPVPARSTIHAVLGTAWSRFACPSPAGDGQATAGALI